MTLIIILIAMAVEHFISVSDEMRRLGWFEYYQHWVENHLAHYKIWNGAGGVICTLLLPLLLVIIIDSTLRELFLPLGLLFALAVLLYTLGPKYLNAELDDYSDALEKGNKDEAEILASEFVSSETSIKQEQIIFENIFVQANERLFGVLFWFIVLGPFGALLYRLAILLRIQQSDIHGNYADAARDLCDILNWPSARLLALGFALSGDLVDAIEAYHVNHTPGLTAHYRRLAERRGLLVTGGSDFHGAADRDHGSMPGMPCLPEAEFGRLEAAAARRASLCQ